MNIENWLDLLATQIQTPGVDQSHIRKALISRGYIKERNGTLHTNQNLDLTLNRNGIITLIDIIEEEMESENETVLGTATENPEPTAQEFVSIISQLGNVQGNAPDDRPKPEAADFAGAMRKLGLIKYMKNTWEKTEFGEDHLRIAEISVLVDEVREEVWAAQDAEDEGRAEENSRRKCTQCKRFLIPGHFGKHIVEKINNEKVASVQCNRCIRYNYARRRN